MLEQDKKILQFIRDASHGSVSRERLLKAFKRSGATVGKYDGSPTIFFGTEHIPIGRGEIEMSTPHLTFRSRLSNLAANVLMYNEIRENLGLNQIDKKPRAKKPMVLPFATPTLL